MADKKISDLTAATSVSDGDFLIIENSGGNSRKVDRANFRQKHRGALVTKAADQTAANYTAGAAVAWDLEDYDTDAIHDTVTNNTRLTVPSGVTKVRLSCNFSLSSLTVNLWTRVVIQKGGTGAYVGVATQQVEVNAAIALFSCTSPILTVVAGNYFEVVLTVSTDTSITVEANESWFAMEIVE